MSRRAADTRGVVAGSRAGAGRAADPWVVAEVLLPRESVGFACRDWTCRRSVETVRPGGDPSDRLSQRAGRAGAIRVLEPCGGAGRARGVTGGGAGRACGTGSAGQGGRAGRELAQRAGRGAETGGLGGSSDATHSVVSQASRDQGQTRCREGRERGTGKPHGARGPGSGSRAGSLLRGPQEVTRVLGRAAPSPLTARAWAGVAARPVPSPPRSVPACPAAGPRGRRRLRGQLHRGALVWAACGRHRH